MEKKRVFYFQRKFKRRMFAVPVGAICHDQGSFEKAVQVSEGGILIQTHFTYRVGDDAELSFFIPDGDFVSVQAKVVYLIHCASQEVLVGLRFIDVPENDLHALRSYVENDKVASTWERRYLTKPDFTPVTNRTNRAS